MCILISNTKFLSLILWLGELCTDADDANTYANDNCMMDQIRITMAHFKYQMSQKLDTPIQNLVSFFYFGVTFV